MDNTILNSITLNPAICNGKHYNKTMRKTIILIFMLSFLGFGKSSAQENKKSKSEKEESNEELKGVIGRYYEDDLPVIMKFVNELPESKIISKQTMPNGSLNDTYEHNHALRKAITPYNGTPLKINASTVGLYEAGRVFEKEFEVSVSSKWVKDNCSVVILVNRFDASSKEVMQATEVELK